MSAIPADVALSEASSTQSSQAALERRNELILSFRPYVIRVAHAIILASPSFVELDDLIGWGFLGLIEAAERFDESRGVPFRSYAHYRIKGAIYDGLRREFGVHRPSQLQDADVRDESRTPNSLCADAAYDEATTSDIASVFSGPGPEHLIWIGELRALIGEAMQSLSPIERDVLHHRYFLDKPVVDLSGARKLSKSWLSRIHTRALARLRKHVEEQLRSRERRS